MEKHPSGPHGSFRCVSSSGLSVTQEQADVFSMKICVLLESIITSITPCLSSHMLKALCEDAWVEPRPMIRRCHNPRRAGGETEARKEKVTAKTCQTREAEPRPPDSQFSFISLTEWGKHAQDSLLPPPQNAPSPK